MAESTESSMATPGTISWTEIPALSFPRAEKFYTSLFGWSFTTPPSTCPVTGKPIEPTHCMFTKGLCHGSLVKVEPENHLSVAMEGKGGKEKKAVTVTVTVESVDSILAVVEKEGGEVWMPKMKIPGENMGYLAYILDTEKNVMGIWSRT